MRKPFSGKNLNFNRTVVAMAALVIVFAGIKLAAEIVVPFLLALFIAIICSPVIKAMTQRKYRMVLRLPCCLF